MLSLKVRIYHKDGCCIIIHLSNKCRYFFLAS